jgi:acetoin utilization deacetylase AcuC-like enzyme
MPDSSWDASPHTTPSGSPGPPSGRTPVFYSSRAELDADTLAQELSRHVAYLRKNLGSDTRMNVIYSDIHRQHAPPHQFNVDRMGAYSECPERADRILTALRADHEIVPPRKYNTKDLLPVHSADYLSFFENVYHAWESGGGSTDGLIPYTFASRSMEHIPNDLVNSAGYYCFDPQTPIVAGTYTAARESANCALSAADLVLEGDKSVYALCRPPGHHASRDQYGGYCYLNNAAIAAEHLRSRVAIIDIDYHHGNGTQSIFYDRPDVLFISIHADPNRAYPFFTGSPSETGTGAGTNANKNYALAQDVDDQAYLEILHSACTRIKNFAPEHLIVSAGFDIYENDPLGDFRITFDGFSRIASAIKQLDLPTIIIQEGGYNTDELGSCVSHFLSGFETS